MDGGLHPRVHVHVPVDNDCRDTAPRVLWMRSGWLFMVAKDLRRPENMTTVSTSLLCPPQPPAQGIPHPATPDAGLLATSSLLSLPFLCLWRGGVWNGESTLLPPALRKVGAEYGWRWGDVTAGALLPSEWGEASDPDSTLFRKLHSGCASRRGVCSPKSPRPLRFLVYAFCMSS